MDYCLTMACFEGKALGSVVSGIASQWPGRHTAEISSSAIVFGARYPGIALGMQC